MSYKHIDNLYKNPEILMFKECYVMEKVHGTSAHIIFSGGKLSFFSGGSDHKNFVGLFDEKHLFSKFAVLVGQDELSDITIYGEAYGGKMQGMRDTYGDELRFIAFEVKWGNTWLSVPDAEEIVGGLDLEFMPYTHISTTLEAIDAERDRPSEVAQRRGCGEKKREGIVLRPLIELRKNNGERIVAKHKNEEFGETKTKRKVLDSDKLQVLEEATAIADEWVTEMRLTHVLDGLRGEVGIEHMGEIIVLMIADVEREAEGEIVESKAARKAIGKRTATMYKRRLKDGLYNSEKETEE